MEDSGRRPDTKHDTPVVPLAVLVTTAAAAAADTNIPVESDLRNVKTTTTTVVAASVNATPSVPSTFVCEFCEEKFTSRNLLFQHLRGNKNDKTQKRGHHNKKSKQSNDVNILSHCQRIQQQRKQQYTTTANSTTTAVESDIKDENSSLLTAPTIIPLPPSIMKKQQRQIQLAQEKLLRNANKRKGRPSTGIGTNTVAMSTTENHAAASSSMLWMGDLPLLWTTRQRNHQRLRMLLRAHIPRTIPTPHIKLVHRKAYRCRYKNDGTRQNQENANSILAHTANIDGDDSTLPGTTGSTDMRKINNESLESERTMVEDSEAGLHRVSTSPQQEEEEPYTVNSHQNSDVSDNNPYLGYAILVFRDEEECTTVLRELDQREVTLQSVFSTTDDIEQNKDFYNLIRSSSDNSGTFRIKVRPVDHHHTVPKQQLAQHNDVVATTDLNDASTMAVDRNVPQQDQDSIGTTNKPTLVVSHQDPPIIDRLQPLSTQVLIQRIKALGGDTSTLATTISPESLLLLSSAKSTKTNKKSDPDSSEPPALLTILQDQHDRALQHAVHVYQTCTPKIIYHEGRLIPTHLRDKLLSLLTNLRWAVPNHRSGMNTERYLVLLSNVQNDVFYSDIRNACKELMTSCTDDPSFYYSGIAITKNFVGSPHIDDRDQTYQYALSLGNFTHGGELCVDGGIVHSVKDDSDILPMTTINSSIETNHLIDSAKATAVPAIHVINTHNRIARVDGRHVHWVRTWENRTNSSSCDRYSLIFYDTSARCPTPVVDMTNFSVV